MKEKLKPIIITFLLSGLFYYILLPPLNLSSFEFYLFVIFIIIIYYLCNGVSQFKIKRNLINDFHKNKDFSAIHHWVLTIALTFIGIIIINFFNLPFFSAKKYYNRITIKSDGVFEKDVSEVDFNFLPLLDKASSQKLGDRVMGQMSELVSQFSVSDLYTQINYKNEIVRVTPLEYANVIKYFTNRKEGVKGYIILNSVTGKAELVKLTKGMRYMPSALFNENLYRKLRFKYPLEIFGTEKFELDNKGALVTGSNASGKSTYLRTIGINTVFAQTFFIALAKEYDSNYYRLQTSIGTTDSIEEGDSYFMAEAKSLKRIVDSLEGNAPVLCILDEIFRGTNTAERISAAREVLNYMIDRNTLVVAATHDLELTSIVNDNFHNYHFKEDIEEHDITFDYILRRGPATSRNAIAILRYLGYPKLIYENADKTVEEYTYAIGTHNK